jgi:hypothetical protein
VRADEPQVVLGREVQRLSPEVRGLVERQDPRTASGTVHQLSQGEEGRVDVDALVRGGLDDGNVESFELLPVNKSFDFANTDFASLKEKITFILFLI